MKGVIVAAGYGSRFLPITKTVPKELLPMLDKPAIDFILDEFEDADITDVIVITSRRKKALEDYLDREVELEGALQKSDKKELLDSIRPRNIKFTFVRQQEMLGTGHALLQIQSIVGDEPFVVAYPDDLVLAKPGLSRQMVESYQKYGLNILAVREETENPSRYGVVDPVQQGEITLIKGIVEKPAPGTEPSNLVSIGRYLFTPELLDILSEQYKTHTSGEFYHIGGINALAAGGKVMVQEVKGLILDTGEPMSYFRSLLEYAWSMPTARRTIEDFLTSVRNR